MQSIVSSKNKNKDEMNKFDNNGINDNNFISDNIKYSKFNKDLNNTKN